MRCCYYSVIAVLCGFCHAIAVWNCCPQQLQQGFIERFVLIQDRVFFIDGPSGTGKSFLYNLLLAYVWALAQLTLEGSVRLIWRRYSNGALHLLGRLKHSNVTLQLGEGG